MLHVLATVATCWQWQLQGTRPCMAGHGSQRSASSRDFFGRTTLSCMLSAPGAEGALLQPPTQHPPLVTSAEPSQLRGLPQCTVTALPYMRPCGVVRCGHGFRGAMWLVHVVPYPQCGNTWPTWTQPAWAWPASCAALGGAPFGLSLRTMDGWRAIQCLCWPTCCC